MKLNNSSIIAYRGVPDWMTKAAQFFVDLFDLQEYKIHIHYAALKSVNKSMRSHRLECLAKTDAAACVVDTTYLIAHVYFVRPVITADENGLAVVAHELIHIWKRHNVFSRIQNEAVDAPEQYYDESKALRIEERSVEKLINILDKLSVFDKLGATIFKK